MEGLEELIWKVISGKVIYQSIYATVTKINDDQTIVCEGLDTQTVYTDVQLTATETKDAYILITPKIGSTVILSFLNNNINDAYVSGFSAINKLEISAEETVFNGGKNGGLIIWEKLKSDLDKMNEILNAVLVVLSGAPISEPGLGSPSALQVALKTAVAGKTTPTLSDLEIINDKVKH